MCSWGQVLGRFFITYSWHSLLTISLACLPHKARTLLALRHQLYSQGQKCTFHQATFSFWATSLEPEGVPFWRPVLKTIWDLQQFLGFTNFYRRFIRGFSSIAAPLSAFLKGKPRRLPWNSADQSAFEHLKCLFTTTSILGQEKLRREQPGATSGKVGTGVVETLAGRITGCPLPFSLITATWSTCTQNKRQCRDHRIASPCIVRGKPRNLNQKRTQTRPKAVGTICPSDVAGREIWNIRSLCGKQRQVYHLIFRSLLVCLTQTLHRVNKY